MWWLFFSRAPWAERLYAIALMVIAVVVTKRVVHPSIAGGMMGFMLPIFSIPPLSLALAAGRCGGGPPTVHWTAASGDGRSDSSRVRRVHVHPN